LISDWFALNFSNADLVTAMTAALREEPNATLDTALVEDATFSEGGVTLTLSTGRVVEADVVAAADGQKSPLRQAAGIGTRDWTYDQVALTFHVTHTQGSRGHLDRISHPLGTADLCALRPLQIERRLAGDAGRGGKAEGPVAAGTGTACQRRSSSLLGDLTIAGPTGAVPMRGLIAKSATAPRLMLAGEALHVFPPVGAQGMNLGFRDAQGRHLGDCRCPRARAGPRRARGAGRL
jgi:2-octaprenyl-6-methoxyphenol hydroxylase